MKKLFLSICVALLPGIMYATTIKISLSEAIKNKTITADGINFQGGYKGKTTRLMITNNTKSVVQIKVDPGMVLKPDIDTYQPMVLAGDEFVMVMPASKGTIEVNTFCGDAPKGCPAINLHYTFSHVGSDTLVKVLQYLKKNSIEGYTGQDAVWVVTNNHSIEGVSGGDPLKAAALRDYLSTVTGRPKAQYIAITEHAPEIPDAPAYVPRTMKIIANFEVALDAQKTLTLGVYNDSGIMVQKVFEDQVFGKADRRTGHKFGVEFEAEGALKGYYYIRLKEGEMVLKETKVRVD